MDKPREQINTNSKAKCILVIDDDNTSCLLIREILEDFNVKIITIKSGKKAIEYIEKVKEMDLVIIDIRLPDINGFEILKRLKATSRFVPVIALTALVNKQIKEICLNAGFNEFIEKPTDIDLLLSVINKYII